MEVEIECTSHAYTALVTKLFFSNLAIVKTLTCGKQQLVEARSPITTNLTSNVFLLMFFFSNLVLCVFWNNWPSVVFKTKLWTWAICMMNWGQLKLLKLNGCVCVKGSNGSLFSFCCWRWFWPSLLVLGPFYWVPSWLPKTSNSNKGMNRCLFYKKAPFKLSKSANKFSIVIFL